MGDQHGLQARSPVAALALTALRLLEEDPAPPSLAPEDLALARRYGIEIEDAGALVPLARTWIARQPLPFPGSDTPTRPNVIVLFLESLSADLLEPYGMARAGLTPHLADMAGRSMRVDGYYNHTAPTVRGLRGQLCSSFPSLNHHQWSRQRHKPVSARLHCLPHVLRQGGYRSVYLTHARANEVNMESQCIDMGFDEMFFRKRVFAELVPGAVVEGIDQPTDRQMFGALIRYLDRRHPHEPFFLAMSTIQTHTDWDVGRDGVVFGDGSNRVLNTVHNLDDAFGTFWSWFLGSRYAADTILVVTGDHTIRPHAMAHRAIGPHWSGKSVDRMALLVYDPTHDLPPVYVASTSSVDFAPSLLHLLHWKDVPNGFVGLSMFSDRHRYLGGPGEGETDDTVLDWEGGRPRVTAGMEARCLDPAQAGTHPCSVRRLLAYLRSLETGNRLWRE